MGLGGLEPPTSRLSGVRSNQLSYRPTPRLRCGGNGACWGLLVLRPSLGAIAGEPRPRRVFAGSAGHGAGHTCPSPELQKEREQRTDLKVREVDLGSSRRHAIAPDCEAHDARRPGLPRKEVIQPHLPVRLPCYDLAPITGLTLGACPLAVGVATSGAADFRGLTGGVYKARERIHRCLLISDY